MHVPIHVTLSGEQIADQIATSGARLVFVSSGELLAKFAGHLSHGETVIVHDEHAIGEEKPPLREIRSSNADGSVGASPSRAAADDLATILFTSGTTGRPRGVMLSQGNLAWNAAAAADAHHDGTVETRLNILPFSHIYARTCDLYTWLYRGSRLVLGESRETLARDCQLVQPTVLSGVPYLFERIADRVRASGVADEAAALAGVFGGRMKLLVCGGAAVAPEVEAWYADRRMPLLPGYGLTETSPVISLSTPASRKLGSVGRPLAGLDVRIAADGEILVRGPNVMLGYWQDEAATAEAIRDGWLHTGDLGALDGDGFLTIGGRKKELIVLSTGKKVLPTRVESLLGASPLVDQVAVFGEGRAGLVALIVPAACSLAPDAAGAPRDAGRRDRSTARGRCRRRANPQFCGPRPPVLHRTRRADAEAESLPRGDRATLCRGAGGVDALRVVAASGWSWLGGVVADAATSFLARTLYIPRHRHIRHTPRRSFDPSRRSAYISLEQSMKFGPVERRGPTRYPSGLRP